MISFPDKLKVMLNRGRHAHTAAALYAGLGAMGLDIVASPEHRVPSLTAVRSPDGVPEADVRKYLFAHHSIEVSGGLSDLAGKVWRVGLMGHNSTISNVLTFLSGLENALADQGFEVAAGAGVAAAQRSVRPLSWWSGTAPRSPSLRSSASSESSPVRSWSPCPPAAGATVIRWTAPPRPVHSQLANPAS